MAGLLSQFVDQTAPAPAPAAPPSVAGGPLSAYVAASDTALAADPEKQARQVLGLSDELNIPRPTVERFGPEIQADYDWFRARPADPADVGSAPPGPGRPNPITLREQVTRMDALDWANRVPFSGTAAGETADLLLAVTRLKQGNYPEPIVTAAPGQMVLAGAGPRPEASASALRDRDIQRVESWLLKRQEVAERGQTFAAAVFDGASYMPAWMIEFALTGGLAQLGSETAREIGAKTLQGYAKTTAGRGLLATAGWTGGALTRTTLGLPNHIADEILQRRIPALSIGPEGELSIAVDPESWATSILKGWGEAVIQSAAQAATQEVGAPLARAALPTVESTLARLPFGRALYDGLERMYLATHPETGAAATFASDFFRKAGFDGILNQMGENRLQTVLEGLTGTQDFGAGPAAGPLERLRAGLTRDFEIRRLAVEAATLALPASAHLVAQVAQKRSASAAAESTAAVLPGKALTHGQEMQGAQGSLAPEAAQGATPVAPAPLPAAPGAATAAESPSGAVIGSEGRGRVENTIAAALKKAALEGTGQNVLDQLEVEGVSPRDVHDSFWREVYPNLPLEEQRRFERGLAAVTGMKPGDVLEVDRGTGERLVARNWQDIAANDIIVADHPDQLEGVERGLVVYEALANRLYADALHRPGAAEAPLPALPAKSDTSTPPAPEGAGVWGQALAAAEAEAAAQARERFIAPTEFTFQDYARALEGASEPDLAALARRLGTKVPGATGENLRQWVGDAVATLTKEPEPPAALEGEPHPGSMTYKRFFVRYGQALESPTAPASAAWLARYAAGESTGGPRGLYKSLVDEWHRLSAWQAFYDLTSQPRPPAESPPAPAAPQRALGETELRDQIADAETREVRDAGQVYAGQRPPTDLPPVPPAPPAAAGLPARPDPERPPYPWELALARQVLDHLGLYHDADTGKPLADKDLWKLWGAFQLPHDRAIQFPQYAPLRDLQVERQRKFRIMVQALAEKSKPYFDLTDEERTAVDQLLVAIDQDQLLVAIGGGPGNGKLHAALQAALTEKQRAGAQAFRRSLDDIGELYVKQMEDLGVRQEWIDQFRGRIGNYIPHTWPTHAGGDWVVIVRDPATKATLYKGQIGYLQRKTEMEVLRERYPEAEVIGPIRATKTASETYQASTLPAVQSVLEHLFDRVNAQAGQIPGITVEQKDAIGQAVLDWWKAKGWGGHFIHREETPGWTGDLRRPFAQYLQGAAGSITKMEAALGFSRALGEIDPARTPNLFARAVADTQYWLGDDTDWGRLIPLIYATKLWARVSSAVGNLTQNLQLGWPVLSKNTTWPLARLLDAMADTATGRLTDAEKAYLARKEAEGFLDPKLALEISGRGGSAAVQALKTPLAKVGSALDFMGQAERFNRQSMYIACLRAGLADPAAEAGGDPADDLVTEAHFEYGKGNRPAIARGLFKPLALFKTWNLNYLTWQKNQLEQGEYAALARSKLAQWLLVGLGGGALTGPLLYWLYPRVAGSNPEEDLEQYAGETATKILLRGVPSLANVSLRGSLGMQDLVPLPEPKQSWPDAFLKELGGVPEGLAADVGRAVQDLGSRNYERLLEDFPGTPQFIRSPLAAYRLSTEGATTRTGRSILDLDSGRQMKLTAVEAGLKALGFAPDRVVRETDRAQMLAALEALRGHTKQGWADRLYLALKTGNQDEIMDVGRDWQNYNADLLAHGEPGRLVPWKDVLEMTKTRAKPVNLPSPEMLPLVQQIWGK
jgi:hypothetical protein